MRWLDARKVRNQLKLAGRVSPILERELVAGINLNGYLRKMVREEFVRPARIAIAEKWHNNTTTAEQAVLEREAGLAVLACATIKDAGAHVGGREVMTRSVVTVAVEMIQVDVRAAKRDGHSGRAISVNYSSVPDEALSQLIAAWGAALNIDHPNFRSVILQSKTLENWGAFREFVGGALTGMGRSNYQAMYEKAVESIVDMPARQRELALEAVERITAERRVAIASHGAKVKPDDGPAVGSPEWKQANAILFLSSSALLNIEQQTASLVHEWVKEHPINELPWEQVLGPKLNKLAGLVGSTLLVDGILLSYAVVLGAAASKHPRFFNCRVHKELESEFLKQNADALQLGGVNRDLFTSSVRNGVKQRSVTDAMVGVETLQRIRTAAWNYADPERPAPSEAARLVRLTEATVMMQQMVQSPGCEPFVLGLTSKMMETASASIAALIKEYQESPTSI